MANLYSKTAICLLSFGLALSQTAAFAGDSDLLAAANMPPVKVRATEDSQVLSGHITDNVESLSKDILRDEVKLQRFNLGFRQNNNKQGRWKGWRYFVTQEGNLGLTEAGLIVGAGERGEHVHGSKAANTSHNKLANGGVMLGAIGNIVAGGGSALELGINEYHAIEAEQHGYGSKQARDTAVKLVGEIDNKLIQRKHLIEQQPPADKEIAEMQEMEGAVLNDFRDLAIAEFERFSHQCQKITGATKLFLHARHRQKRYGQRRFLDAVALYSFGFQNVQPLWRYPRSGFRRLDYDRSNNQQADRQSC